MNGVSRSFQEYPGPKSAVEANGPLAANGPLVGASTAMQEVFRLIERVGPTDASVLLTGESGTGKALAARAIHEFSTRRASAFISINCGAMPSLIEAELFGSETAPGAAPARAGAFERAQGGTLLLDEITELPQRSAGAAAARARDRQVLPGRGEHR